ncbi:MAG: aminotransferase class V-fold PLP-dependent enzyme [Nitrososphaerota archaeon]
MSLLAELGLRPVINGVGTMTLLGGTTLSAEVLEAMREASQVYLDMNMLHLKAGEYIAKLLGVEDAYITSGAGAGIVLAISACIALQSPEVIVTLPRTGRRFKVLVQKRHRNIYDYIVGIAGAELVEVGGPSGTTESELEEAIDGETCAVMYFASDHQPGTLSLETVVKIAHSRDLPVIVDAAAELPPRENLRRFYELGADAVLFSAGKDMGAPNDTGIVIGRRRIVELCRRLGPHNYEKTNGRMRVFIGRPMKSSKEDILAVVAALKRYLEMDEEARLRGWEAKTDYMVSELRRRGVDAVAKIYPGGGFEHPRPSCIPRVEVRLSSPEMAEEVLKTLREDDPPIQLYSIRERIYINPQCLRDGEEKIVAEKLAEKLRLKLNYLSG